jgi:O-antigen biosynthesis protein WbqP
MKRLIEIFFCIILFIILLIPIIFISIIIKFETKGNILYWSERVGLDNSIFRMPKFRTMKIDTPVVATDLLRNPQNYVTKFGSFLRRYSLDEIPQLWSILVGDMSLIGPRPALYNQYKLIELRTIKGIHKIKPGLTGLAQINGRDNIKINKKINYDLYYLVNYSVCLDVYIFIKTIAVVLTKKDIKH